MKLIDKKLFKFLLVGIVNTIVGSGIMFLLFNIADVSYWIASACNYIVGGILSFFLNKFFTFQNKKKSLKQVILFVLNLLVCYLIAYVFAKKAVYYILLEQSEKTQGNVALALGMCLYTGLNYIGQRFLVFAEKEQKVEING